MCIADLFKFLTVHSSKHIERKVNGQNPLGNVKGNAQPVIEIEDIILSSWE